MITGLVLTRFISFCEERGLDAGPLKDTYLFNGNHYRLFAEDCAFQDLSFVKVYPDGLIFFPLIEIDGFITSFGRPVEGHRVGVVHEVGDDVYSHLKVIAAGKKILLSKKTFVTAPFSSVEDVICSHAFVNLEQDERSILNDMSKGHKADVQKGQKLLKVLIQHSPNDMGEFARFYEEVAGMSKTSNFWKHCELMVEEGSAFLVKAYLSETLVSASFFMAGKSEVYYALGAYRRDVMKEGIPLSHYPMFEAILYAKAKAYRSLELGFHVSHGENAKEKAIFDFKRRFSSQTISNPSFLVS